ncbi:MAG: hypothetical protein P8Y71_01900 [Pseudolabrys sp.]|jgi:hypothetical protein
MDTRNIEAAPERQMQGLHVLAVLPPFKKDRTKQLLGLLKPAKARWNWRVSVLCDGIERKAYGGLVAPDGAIFAKPHLLRAGSWEDDSGEVRKTEDAMRDAERIAGTTAGRIILAAGHSVGRGFNLSVRHIRKYALVRRVLRDNTEPFRIVRRLFRFADEMLDSAKPDLVYTFEWATPLNYCIWLAAQRRGIPCVALRYSKITPDHAFWTTDRLMMNVRAVDLARQKVKAGAKESSEACDKIAAFRTQPRVINYIAARWQNKHRRNFLRWHWQNSRIVVREFINMFRGQDLALREPPLSRFLRYYHSLYLGGTHRRFFNVLDEDALAKMKYIYFPLHKEAELAQTFQATLWHDQRNTVSILASMLPNGYRLLVREHRMNVGHRPTSSYKRYEALPNVTLIDPYDSQFKYLQHAALIVTENGSSGWEGLLLGRRVLTLSRTFYDGAGLGTKAEQPELLNLAILDALAVGPVSSPSEWDRALGCVIDGDRETTFPLNDETAALERLHEALRPLLAGGGESQAVTSEMDAAIAS